VALHRVWSLCRRSPFHDWLLALGDRALRMRRADAFATHPADADLAPGSRSTSAPAPTAWFAFGGRVGNARPCGDGVGHHSVGYGARGVDYGSIGLR